MQKKNSTALNSFRVMLSPAPVVWWTILFLAAATIQLWATQTGVGLTPDSLNYLEAAKNLMSGKGLWVTDGQLNWKPMTHHAPGYPILLAASSILTGLRLETVARWINALFFALNTLLLMWMVFRLSGRDKLVSILAGCYFVFCRDILALHARALTEPIFLFFGFVGLWYLLSANHHKGENAYLILGSLCIGCAWLLRYAAMPFVLVGALLLFFAEHLTWKQRFQKMVVFAFISCTGMAAWLVRNAYLSGGPTDNRLSYYPISEIELFKGFETILGWFMPYRVPLEFRMILFLLVFLVLLALTLRMRSRLKQPALRSCFSQFWLLFFALIYSGFVIAMKLFMDKTIPLDFRILLPVQFAVMCVLFSISIQIMSIPSRRLPYLAGHIGLSMLVFITILRGSVWIHTNYQDSTGYASSEWKNSPVAEFIENLDAESVVYSNGWNGIRYNYGYNARRLRNYYPPMGLNSNGKNAPEKYFAATNKQIRDGMAFIIFYPEITWGSNWTNEQLEKTFMLRVIAKMPEAIVYQLEAGEKAL